MARIDKTLARAFAPPEAPSAINSTQRRCHGAPDEARIDADQEQAVAAHDHIVRRLHRKGEAAEDEAAFADLLLGSGDGREMVRLHGFEHKVRARIARIGGFSAHADRSELVQWITSLQAPPKRVFVVHGESDAAEAFGTHLTEATGWKVTVPDYRNEYVLD